jgi:F0F1-type ATP synthase epsilon subunit
MNLSIISPQETVEHVIAWIEINTPVGNMVIQKDHIPMIVELAPNKEIAYQLSNGKQQSMHIARGFLHVTRTAVKIIISR